MARGEASPSLTVGGVERLFGGVTTAEVGGVRVQVLGVYRYAVDPAFKARVGLALAPETERYAFDLLVSDGRHKMKCLLSPDLNEFVWKRRVQPLDVVLITKFEALETAGGASDAHQPRVIVVNQLKVVARAQKKIVRVEDPEGEGLAFISSTSSREVVLVPLVGERRYYLPLSSDHYSLDRSGSFTGKRDKWSPPDELEAADPPELGNFDWETERLECASLFSKSHRKVLTISEVIGAIDADRASGGQQPPPPMVGTIRVKSKVTHLADPDILSEFPFAFHIVLVDCTSVVEVAFYGAMCAKYFLSLEEGDLVQLRGYRLVPQEAVNPECEGDSPVYMFDHRSIGCVRHVPRKYWSMLEAFKVIPPPTPTQESDEEGEDGGESDVGRARKRPRWLELALAATQDVQLWSDQSREGLDQLYFDFVGVLSFVGKICRRRERKGVESAMTPADHPSDKDGAFTEYRWVKAIDQSSTNELVILVDECSQPAAFRALEAGAFVMLTKLQRTILGSTGTNAIQHASTSSLSVLRLNDDVNPFLGVEACRLNSVFARSIEEKTELEMMKMSGESKLGGYMMREFRPVYSLPTDTQTFMRTFGVSPLSFRQLREIHERMETFECQHVGLLAPVREISSRGKATVEREANVFVKLGDLDDMDNVDSTLTVRVAVNPLFRPTALPDMENLSALAESLPLMCIMSPSLLRSLVNHRPRAIALKLDGIHEWMAEQEREVFFFSLRMFRNSRGNVEWETDAVLPAQ